MNAKKRKTYAAIKSNSVKERLEEIKMSQTELADLCNTTRPHIHRIMNNLTNGLSLVMAMRIAKALNQPVEKLFKI